MELDGEVPNLDVLAKRVKSEKAKVLKSSNRNNKYRPNEKGTTNINSAWENKRPPIKRKSSLNTQTNDPKRTRPNETSTEKPDWKQYKEEKRDLKMERRKSDKGEDVYQIMVNAKLIWEDLRRKDCPSKKKEQLSSKLFELIKDHLSEFICTHDLSRVIETLMVTGNNQMRGTVLDIYKANYQLAFKKYSNFVILKAMRHATAEQRKEMNSVFIPVFLKLMCEPRSRELAELIFEGIPTTQHRLQCISHVKNGQRAVPIKEWIALRPALQKDSIAIMAKHINKMLNHKKDPISMKYHMLHLLLLEYFSICAPEEKERVLKASNIREKIVEVLPTKAGSSLAMDIFWNSSPKERKVMVKALKGKSGDIACKQYGHIALLAILDSLDDTTLLAKAIISDLIRNVHILMENPYGRKVVRYLVDPRNKMDISSVILSTLKQGDENPYSKKDMAMRRKEILDAANEDLLAAVLQNMESWIGDGKIALVLFSIFQKCFGPKLEEAIAKLAQCVARKKPVECIEIGGTFIMLKKLIEGKPDVADGTGSIVASLRLIGDKKLNVFFIKLLLENFEKETLQEWSASKQGNALLGCIRATSEKEKNQETEKLISKLKIEALFPRGSSQKTVGKKNKESTGKKGTKGGSKTKSKLR